MCHFRERNVSYHGSTRAWLAPRGVERRGVERSPLPWKGKVIFAWVGEGEGETSVPSPAWPIVADRSIDRGIVSARLIYLRRETRVKREMDSKEDRFGTADLTRYPINRRPAFVHTPSPSSLPYYPRLVHVSGMRWRGANLDRPTLRSTASPPLLFCDRGKFYFQFQRSFHPGRFVERKMHR